MNEIPIRDIHLPEMYGWWPPAAGWWLLILIILLLIFGIRWLVKTRRFRTPDQIAANHFSNIKANYPSHSDKARLLQELSILLRRTCMTYLSRQQTASITGEAWITQLDLLVGKSCFDTGMKQLLISGPYLNQPEFDATELLRCCQQWIESLPEYEGKKR